MATFNAEPRTLGEATYTRLRSDIVWGNLVPGERLRSDDLRERYSVGISPLREALTRLASERLVISSGQRGFVVAPITSEDIRDVTETRLSIEKIALTKSLQNGDAAWETQLVAAHHALALEEIPQHYSERAEAWTEKHRGFHMALISACQSDWLMYLSGLLFDQAERFRVLRATNAPNLALKRDIGREHQIILEAALGRDVLASHDALSQHYMATMRKALSTLDGTEDGGG